MSRHGGMFGYWTQEMSRKQRIRDVLTESAVFIAYSLWYTMLCAALGGVWLLVFIVLGGAR